MKTITITINHLTWDVYFVDKNHEKLVDEDGKQDAYGITLFRECEIYIDAELPSGMLRRTITHELVHAIAFTYGVHLDKVDEEEICEFIASIFDELKTLRKAVLKAL